MFRYNDNVKSMQHYGRDGNNRRCLVVCFIDFFISFFFFFVQKHSRESIVLEFRFWILI